eukprot:scaffold2383_cov75-Cyclotella_meneghiniana.AAC.4
MAPLPISIQNGHFRDHHNRILNLRGVNLSGSSKRPSNYTDLHQHPESTTFVNRPFPLIEADAHFARLEACGLSFIRFIVTWEAIEHAAPGRYDVEYLTYVRSIIEKANQYNIYVYIDPHQDVWSRWTGGDGAPLWTLEMVGFDVENLRCCEAAVCQETYGTGCSSKEVGGQNTLPKMMWPTNYFKLATATMFTLFWAGERYAPSFVVEDTKNTGSKMNIQTFLQSHYINAMAELMKYLKGLENVVGIGTMNEPSAGYINVADLSLGFGQYGATSGAGATELRYELAPTPYQGMILGEGIAQTIGEYSNGFMQHVLGRPDRQVLVDPKGRTAWKCDDDTLNNRKGCLWKQEGIWRVNPETDLPELLKPNYFANVDFGKECYLPFATKYANTMQQLRGPDRQLLIFVELPPLEFSSTPFPNISSSPTTGVPNAVNATHWYDGVTLFTRSWRPYFGLDTRTHRPVFGYSNVFNTHCSQLDDIKQLGVSKMENAPTLIGEVGIPFDMQGTNWTSFTQQLAAMDHTISCLEKNLLSYTLWCYTPDNSNKLGDLWNGEDLSVFSNDQMQGLDRSDPLYIYDGMRTAQAVIRPYAKCIAGTPLQNSFDSKKGLYVYCGIENDIKYDVPTEIFVPKYCCYNESDMQIIVSAGKFEVEEQTHHFIVKYWHDGSTREQRVEIQFVQQTKRRRTLSRRFTSNMSSSFRSMKSFAKSSRLSSSD